MTEEDRRKKASENLARYFCVIAGIEPVDSSDGSPNWWMFNAEAETIYDGIRARFPAAPAVIATNGTGGE